MKKGVAGVRLCDVSGCYDRWPCSRHGTLTAGADFWNSCLDLSACPRCGYSLCACSRLPPVVHQEAPSWQPPAGWRHVPASRFLCEFYCSDSIPAPYGFVFVNAHGWACNGDPLCWETPGQAIGRAERLHARSLCAEVHVVHPLAGPTPPPPEEPMGPPARPGWLYDPAMKEYTYPNKPKMPPVFRSSRVEDGEDGEDGEETHRWRVHGVESFLTLQEAMIWVEKLASGEVSLPW